MEDNRALSWRRRLELIERFCAEGLRLHTGKEHKSETRWWKQDVEILVYRKRELFKASKKSCDEVDRRNYYEALKVERELRQVQWMRLIGRTWKTYSWNRDGSELQPRSLSEKDAYGGNCLNEKWPPKFSVDHR